MDPIRVLLVDDHQVVRDGLQHMLELETDIKVVGGAANANEALSLVELLSPDVILMDIKMPGVDGIQLTRQLKERCPACNIIMLTLYDEYLTQAIEAGAAGYLLKDIKREELVKAIREVHQGRSTLNLSLSRERLAELSPSTESPASLSPRELAVLRLVADGIATKDIASRLFLSQSSVKRSLSRIFEKLGVPNRSKAVAEAYKRRLI